MRIVVIGGNGTIGRRLVPALAERGHDTVIAGRSAGGIRVDITSADSIVEMYEQAGAVDGVVVIAASGALDDFATLTGADLLENMRGKFFGQANVVLIGQRYVRDGGSLTLTSGIFADEAWPGVTGGAAVSGALHSFVLSAAVELPRRLRVNVVSPTMVADSADALRDLFPGMRPVAMDTLVKHYVDCVEGNDSGAVIRAYG
ncbi:MAG TPA: short chain dehydrogenase [Pseudonocardia sp.]|jgi:NAD(P)-dependent dehydrogenase (short-subunit alcohol dehydrogenase family)|nr:short chain dehydrogenase [Pseudonocardia sp.]